MAGIAPIDGTTSLAANVAVGTSRATGSADPAAASAGSFTAFPNSYAGFGTGGSAFGQIGVRNGILSVFAPESDAASAVQASAIKPPPPPSPLDIAPPPPPSLLGSSSASGGTTAGDPPAKSDPPGDPPGDPPFGDPFASQPNELTQQLQNQQQAEQEQQQQQADAAQTQQRIAYSNLVTVTFRLSAAYSDNNAAAAAQIKPQAVQLYSGSLQGSIWAGIGTTPPQPFARPEIPTVFLNVAA